MKNLKYFLKKAKKEKWVIFQFNFSVFEQLKGILEAVKNQRVPVILGTSQGEASFFGMREAVLLRDFYRKDFPYIYLNLDHGKNLNLIKKAIDYGYDAVHFDGSSLNFEENIKLTKKITQEAHKKGVLVEGEVLSIKGSSEIHKKKEAKIVLEDINQAKKFVRETKVDSLAINIGNLHGLYPKPLRLNIKHLKKIQKEIPAFLVLHGGSGIKKKDIIEAIQNGVVKININTELRKTWRESLEKSLKKHKETIKPYKILPETIRAIKIQTEKKIRFFVPEKFRLVKK